MVPSQGAEDAGQGAVREADGGLVRAEISPEALRPEAARARVAVPGAGAVVLFVGTVRRDNRGREVAELAYEAYAEMAVEELARVGSEARGRFGLDRVDAVHRVGRLVPGDLAVAVAASARHRGPAFEATRWAMEELKRRVPIWKRESYVDGSTEWLGDGEPGPASRSTGGSADDAERTGPKGERAS